MPSVAQSLTAPESRSVKRSESSTLLAIDDITTNQISQSIYGDSFEPCLMLTESIARVGILEPLVVVKRDPKYLVVSGQKRLASARALGLTRVPCRVVSLPDGPEMTRAILEFNRQRPKTFSQRMREADAFQSLENERGRERRLQNLRQWRDSDAPAPDGRNSDDRSAGRSDVRIARAIGLGGKDLYRQARAVWQASCAGDVRAQASVRQLDNGSKTIFSAYKDLRRRDRFSATFKPTPYDVWAFRHDRAFGVPHPGATPPAMIAHLLYYYTAPDALVVDPMAGGGTTIDVCESMGRRCLAYDLAPVREDVRKRDVSEGFASECRGCDLVFCDPPYHTMHARRYPETGTAAELPFSKWLTFIDTLSAQCYEVLRPGGVMALLMANQTENDLPVGHEYFDHAFFGYEAMRKAGFQPLRRISCPMSGTHLPQQVRRARAEGRLLGLVRDLIVMRKPL